MKSRNWIDWIVIVIGAITIISGGVQVVAPQAVLSMLGVNVTPDVRLLFVILSVYIVLFGAALLHSMLTGKGQSVIALWLALQKLLGSGAIMIGVSQGLVSSNALFAIGYDCLAGLVVLGYWLRIRGTPI